MFRSETHDVKIEIKLELLSQASHKIGTNRRIEDASILLFNEIFNSQVIF